MKTRLCVSLALLPGAMLLLLAFFGECYLKHAIKSNSPKTVYRVTSPEASKFLKGS